MNTAKNKIDEKLIEKIIRTAYGDAGLIEKFIVNRKAKKDLVIKQLLNEYKSAAYAVKSIPPYECPGHLLNDALKRKQISSLKEKSYMPDVLGLSAKQLAISAAAFTVVIVAFITALLVNRVDVEPQYTQTEIKVAEEQVKESLVIVGRVFKKTRIRLEEEIIGKQVKEPLNKGFKILNNLFIGG